ncbi:hypothetical protein Pmani_035272 [Petrolisthes manimaculis]|uniref:Helicase with zinc finger domain n=1 Tax=Petrolisthes manimaculis TaxID=1843537 RepID=A0AAE1NM35_9EUCA|nr:hypothetical protein Pmani_035272 [Petrolisthes manimaculis]
MHGVRQKSRSPKMDPEVEASGRGEMSKSPVTIRGDRSPSGRQHCSYCNVYLNTKMELQAHCRGPEHQTIIMSDEGRDWMHRPPPRGLSAEEYSLCATFKDTHTCRMGDQCIEAHSDAELIEWQERFEYRAMKLERAREKQLHGATYADQLLERLSQAQHQDALINEKSEGIIINMSMEPNLRVSQKPSSHEWVITLRLFQPLRVISLLHDAHRNHFTISEVTHVDNFHHIHKSYEPENNQEWINMDTDSYQDQQTVQEYKATISFKTLIYGTFRQAIIFDWGTEPVLMQRLCVDVVPVEDLTALEETKRTILTQSERWCDENVEIIAFDPKPHELTPHDKSLLTMYAPPTNENFVFTQTSMEKFPTKSNYRSRLHDLLNIEELAQFDLISRFNIKTTLQITNSYLLLPSTASTAKYSRPGELFGKLELTSEISEDSHHGRLVLANCNSMLVSPVLHNQKKGRRNVASTEIAKEGDEGDSKSRRKIFEVHIEDKTKKEIYVRFSTRATAELQLTDDEEVKVEVQFQLNRLPLCEMHSALDHLPSLEMIFPDVSLEPTIPWSPIKQWGENLDTKLNPKQKEALVAITAPSGLVLPPILIIGPYGTGKTYTLAQGIKQILQQPDTRILICTHSNSAADLYIKDYLHPYVEAGNSEARPLRIYYRNRWVTTVHPDVQQYCLIETDQNVRRFVMPSEEEILAHRVIVATLNTSRYLTSLRLKKGIFTHILIDEAAQAMECEALTPLALAKADTRLVLAGDYMQLSPEVYSPFCDERGLGTSLLERLYDLYPADSPCKIMLVENYRSHSAIIKYTSDLFYEGRLLASGRQAAHPKFHPLTFFTARGEDFQDPNSTAFYNNSEVYEVCEQVGEIISHWPRSEWGPVGEGSIGVVTPYADQMVRIRAELRKRKLYKINVERVLNVQGKQFRVIVLSTVRTRHTCKVGDDGLDFGFLSNAKLLTTAITRAQSLVAVVGDPVSLCSVGKCRKLWERFLQLCSEAGSLYGISWSSLRSQLDGVELKKTYVLNPLAPEFIPRYLYYPPMPHLPVVQTVPPYINMYPPYNSYIPTYPMPHPMIGPQALSYLHHTQHLPQPWSHLPYNPIPKPQIVRPPSTRLGPPLIASHSLRPNMVTAAAAAAAAPSSGFYEIPVLYPCPPGNVSHRMPVVRRPGEFESLNRGVYMGALPSHYQHMKQVATPNMMPPHQSNLRMGPRFTRPYLGPTNQLSRIMTQTEGEKSYQFLNNVHFPERQLPPNTSSHNLQPTPFRASSESPSSTHSRESMSEGRAVGRTPAVPPPPLPPPPHRNAQVTHQLLPEPPRGQPLTTPQSNGTVNSEDSTVVPPDVPDVERIIDELIGDHSPPKPSSQWSSFEVDAETRTEAQGTSESPVVDSWANNPSFGVRPPNTNAPQTFNPWAIPSANVGGKIDVGKMVTVQELEASLHGKPPGQNHGMAVPSNLVMSRAPGGPSIGVREPVKVSPGREQEEVQGRDRRDIPPPPGFGGVNRLVDPMSQIELAEVSTVGYRTPSLPLYLRRGSREASSGNMPNMGKNMPHVQQGFGSNNMVSDRNVNISTAERNVSGGGGNSSSNTSSSALWHMYSDNLKMYTSSHGELGLKNVAHAVEQSTPSSVGVYSHRLNTLNSQDGKTYAGVLRSSLQHQQQQQQQQQQPPTSNKSEDSTGYTLKDMADNKIHGAGSHLYQYFP